MAVPILLVVDHPPGWPLQLAGVQVVSARRYLTDPDFASLSRARVWPK